ncbi:50S ribosomal protein L32 [Aeromicrobium sp. YIM 150415]|uniref:Large ribosomal subunit protein bL32 n=1 Tax=Aeromicrobium piscarium TaxID=2590901 RepID=A0A554RX85_9ACTN|nr:MULTISPECIES: 50S ribosomal protein L32 [Aeromicrobium]MBM9463502.1 50S ribosomal protein L32 [Aeromicrobium sp. YIM 150415]TSD58706.1 50S ribosomal protein L32 [Aeromicrobium piscarium]
MAVPKRKTSRSNTRHRRSQWKAKPVDLVPVTTGGDTVRVPRRLVKAVHAGLVDPKEYR